MPEEVYVTLREASEILKRPWETLADWVRDLRLERILDADAHGKRYHYRLSDLQVLDYTHARRQRWPERKRVMMSRRDLLRWLGT